MSLSFSMYVYTNKSICMCTHMRLYTLHILFSMENKIVCTLSIRDKACYIVLLYTSHPLEYASHDILCISASFLLVPLTDVLYKLL